MPATHLASRAIIRVSSQREGEDVRQFLQGLVSQDVTGALPVWSGLLSPQGKVLFDFIVWPDGPLRPGSEPSDILIDCEADAAEALVRRLAIYRLRRAITIAIDPGLAVHWQPEPGPGADHDPRLAALGTRWLAPADPSAASADAAWLAHRLALGVAEGRSELGLGETLWLECNAAELGGVSFTKGCYIGQENTARMNWRQKVSRRLLVVPQDRSDPARQRATYPELGLAIDHLRLEDIDPQFVPAWLQLS